jgi:hypothetical protein
VNQTRIKLKSWLGLSVATFLLLILIHLGLPALFLFLDVPSFSIGEEWWLLRWQNDETGSEIQFNLMFLFVISVVIGFISLLVRIRRKQSS